MRSSGGNGENIRLSSNESSSLTRAGQTQLKNRVGKMSNNKIVIAIIGNCQVSTAYHLLATCSGLTVIDRLDINSLSSEGFKERQQAVIAMAREGSGVIVSHRLGDNFGDIATSALSALNGNYFTTTNIYFSGLHPDIVYLGSFPNKRYVSALGDYHSRIIVFSYIQGVSEAECIARFTGATYEAAGYFDEFEKSAQELRRRDETVDIKFADQFLETVRNNPALYTVNHPIITTIYEQAKKICEFFGVTYDGYPDTYFGNALSAATWWPIYPEIAEYHKLPYRTPPIFKTAQVKGNHYYSIERMVSECYRVYDGVGREALRNCDQYGSIDRQFTFLKTE